jgi:hypothetical protein
VPAQTQLDAFLMTRLPSAADPNVRPTIEF